MVQFLVMLAVDLSCSRLNIPCRYYNNRLSTLPTVLLRLHSKGIQFKSMQSKFLQLQHKLNSISVNQDSNESVRTKPRQVHQIVTRLQQRYDQEAIAHDNKIGGLLEQLKVVDRHVKQAQVEIQAEEVNTSNRINKLEKVIKKSMEKIGKERKESDKRIQQSLETYLLELTNFKGKAIKSCSANVRQLKQLEKDVQILEKDIKKGVQSTEQLHRKIYSQFSGQIQDIGMNLENEKKEREEEAGKVMGAIERMYHRLSGSIQEMRRNRERNERDIVQLLERVIEKIKNQLLQE